MTLSGDDLKRLKELFKATGEPDEGIHALLARLDAAEEYKSAHPCKHSPLPHGACNVNDMGCQYDLRWRKACGL